MASVTFKVEGLSELGRRMSTLKAETAQKFCPRATGKAASIVKKSAKQHLRASPTIETGLLEKNVIAKKIPKRQTQLTSEHIVTVKKRVYPKKGNEKVSRNTRQVGSYKEFGTINNSPEPYLRPGLAQNVTPAIQAMADSLKADIVKAGA